MDIREGNKKLLYAGWLVLSEILLKRYPKKFNTVDHNGNLRYLVALQRKLLFPDSIQQETIMQNYSFTPFCPTNDPDLLYILIYAVHLQFPVISSSRYYLPVLISRFRHQRGLSDQKQHHNETLRLL